MPRDVVVFSSQDGIDGRSHVAFDPRVVFPYLDELSLFALDPNGIIFWMRGVAVNGLDDWEYRESVAAELHDVISNIGTIFVPESPEDDRDVVVRNVVVRDVYLDVVRDDNRSRMMTPGRVARVGMNV